ncbi:uncharacterized protein UV8b_00667 [Ustilaginoidea virens]|uniref:Alpha/beta hydrolase fold-3 domain-containing protein n=1 Tax=Ustilaginoidea virens TaxID=1159556 RepID=A0A8E5MDM3_USTVR|nr:uncharacterized protein UV8b_00667 [Ustilaginoidea virens]QUC16426.1 hypothetical protein UV8b_00667 [Ustilaginoidea virens]
MARWQRAAPLNLTLLLPRVFSTARSERVEVKCGSGGHVTIDLLNMSEAPSVDMPLLVHLPPFPSLSGSPSPLPTCFGALPVANINYRWRPFSKPAGEDDHSTPLHWPTPVHDAAVAFTWLVANLSPPGNTRRDIYVYGSYLGASLAASLALTESHSHARFGVRGFMAYNGIYNWTMFLPDHRINKPRRSKVTTSTPSLAEGSHLHTLQEQIPALFNLPSNLFDPFASPSLFFHSPGLLVPQSFHMTVEQAALLDSMTSDEEVPFGSIKAPRKSHLVFPPRNSTLKIPETLLLFDSAPMLTRKNIVESSTNRRKKRAAAHSFKAQATELSVLMRRSVDGVELAERRKWDDEIHNFVNEAATRVQLVETGPEKDHVQLSESGQDAIASWMQDRLNKLQSS